MIRFGEGGPSSENISFDEFAQMSNAVVDEIYQSLSQTGSNFDKQAARGKIIELLSKTTVDYEGNTVRFNLIDILEAYKKNYPSSEFTATVVVMSVIEQVFVN